MFRRKPKIPFYAKVFAFIAIIYGLIKSEKMAPVMTADLGLKFFIEQGFKVYRKYFKNP